MNIHNQGIAPIDFPISLSDEEIQSFTEEAFEEDITDIDVQSPECWSALQTTPSCLKHDTFEFIKY